MGIYNSMVPPLYLMNTNRDEIIYRDIEDELKYLKAQEVAVKAKLEAEIRKAMRYGMPNSRIAAALGVTEAAIRMKAKRKKWNVSASR